MKRSGPGRPPVHQEPWVKVSMLLLNRQVVFLDRLSSSIREKTTTAVNRAELVRALIDAFEKSAIDVTSARNEEEIMEIVLKKLRS